MIVLQRFASMAGTSTENNLEQTREGQEHAPLVEVLMFVQQVTHAKQPEPVWHLVTVVQLPQPLVMFFLRC